MRLRTSSIPLMLEYVAKSGMGQEDPQAAADILGHEDYLFEARRYGLDSREPLVSYFARFRTIAPEDIPELGPDRRTALRDRHGLWLDCAAHPQKYRDRYRRLIDMLTEENLLVESPPLSGRIGISGTDAYLQLWERALREHL